MVERALLVAIYEGRECAKEAAGLLEELASLVETLGVPVIDQMLVKIVSRNPRFYTGTGKADEIHELIKLKQIDCVVFDNELTPSQQRNWEELTGVCVIDRQEVIIDIFAKRAQTREARLQVDLARMEYSLPRLKRAWTHLDRQGGGIGGRGEGERQIETDRRLVRLQIEKLKDELVKVRSQRATQRKQRERLPLPNAAIVGYTNAGKSSLLKKLTGAQVLVEDKLFATLDTTTRKILLETGQPLLLTDTVGFVRKLPHHLVDAFKATLEEAVLADFLVHVVDGSHPLAREFFNTTQEVLASLGADTKRMLTVVNKMDKPLESGRMEILHAEFPDAIFISTHTGQGLSELQERMTDMLADRILAGTFHIPHEHQDLIALVHREGHVTHSEYQDEEVVISASLPPKFLGALAPFQRNTFLKNGDRLHGI